MTNTRVVITPVGSYLLAAEDAALTGVWLEGQRFYPPLSADTSPSAANDPVLLRADAWLKAYFAGEKPSVADLPLAPAGSAFAQSVWRLLCQIPYGQTTTYGALAKKLECANGKPVCAQAVGGAVAHNPISVIIPCHRVIGANGSLTGYAGGIAVKQKLLEWEQTAPGSFERSESWK